MMSMHMTCTYSMPMPMSMSHVSHAPRTFAPWARGLNAIPHTVRVFSHPKLSQNVRQSTSVACFFFCQKCENLKDTKPQTINSENLILSILSISQQSTSTK